MRNKVGRITFCNQSLQRVRGSQARRDLSRAEVCKSRHAPLLDMAASIESPNRRARPLSMYAAPGYAPASSSSAPRSPNISSPSPTTTTTTTTTRARPNSALGHRTTSSLSSLAQLGLHLPAAKRGGDEVHAPRTPLQENRAFALTTAADRDNSSRISTSPSKAASSNAQYRIQRSNSILMRSPSLAAGQWGAFTAPHSPQAHSPAVGREYEDVQNRTFCKWSQFPTVMHPGDRGADSCSFPLAGSTLVSNRTVTRPSWISAQTLATERG